MKLDLNVIKKTLIILLVSILVIVTFHKYNSIINYNKVVNQVVTKPMEYDDDYLLISGFVKEYINIINDNDYDSVRDMSSLDAKLTDKQYDKISNKFKDIVVKDIYDKGNDIYEVLFASNNEDYSIILRYYGANIIVLKLNLGSEI